MERRFVRFDRYCCLYHIPTCCFPHNYGIASQIEAVSEAKATLNYDIPANLLTSSNKNLEKLLAQCPELKKTST
uniref:Uncharacterized protein n=1 Tax=Romanomermis culicivorax TaxID=13658 RepID=A0A915JS88_ROMCU